MSIRKFRFEWAIGILLLLPACSTPDNHSTASTTSAKDSTAVAQAAAVPVKLSDFKIDMPASLQAGETTFQITNIGKVIHSFEIVGDKLDQKLSTNLQPGETQTLQVNLPAGHYQIYCPVDEHKQAGMVHELTVQ